MKNPQHLYSVTNESKVIPVIPYEEGDELIHSVAHPYCGDPTCPCGGSPPTSTTDDEEVVS